MLQNPQRVEQFTTEIADMKLPDAASSRDRTLLRVGAALMVVGVVVAIVAYLLGHGTTNPLQQRDAIVIAIIGLTLAVVGGALFVRYSMAQFLRFWLARLSWEQQARPTAWSRPCVLATEVRAGAWLPQGRGRPPGGGNVACFALAIDRSEW